VVNMKYFNYDHLPKRLQSVSKEVKVLADVMNTVLPHCAEKAAGMRKLLEAKGCFVRAQLENHFYKGEG